MILPKCFGIRYINPKNIKVPGKKVKSDDICMILSRSGNEECYCHIINLDDKSRTCTFVRVYLDEVSNWKNRLDENQVPISETRDFNGYEGVRGYLIERNVFII